MILHVYYNKYTVKNPSLSTLSDASAVLQMLQKSVYVKNGLRFPTCRKNLIFFEPSPCPRLQQGFVHCTFTQRVLHVKAADARESHVRKV